MQALIDGKRVNIDGYTAALERIAQDAIPGTQKVAVYLDIEGNKLETVAVSNTAVGVDPAPGDYLVGLYGSPVSRASFSWDIRTAIADYDRRMQLERELIAYEKFQNAESGGFNGFAFGTLFHRDYKKERAIWVGEADDCADVHTPYGTFHVGEDGITVYLMSEKPTKTVSFNRSAYLI